MPESKRQLVLSEFDVFEFLQRAALDRFERSFLIIFANESDQVVKLDRLAPVVEWLAGGSVVGSIPEIRSGQERRGAEAQRRRGAVAQWRSGAVA